MIKLKATALFLTACFLLAGCGRNDDDISVRPHNPIPPSSSPELEESGWSYDTQQDWTVECGQMQSPINIETNSVVPMEHGGSLMLYYLDTLGYLEDNGHAIEAGLQGAAMINRRIFAPAQVHFHAHSEHMVDGEYYPMEVHFVHEAQDGRIAIIAVFLTAGEENEAFGQILSAARTLGNGNSTTNPPDADMNQLLPDRKDYYHYLGSLAAPPLTENVEWYVLATPVEVSQKQIQQFQKLYNGNYREIQETNNREILYYHP